MSKVVIKLVGITFKNKDKSSRQELLGYVYDEFWTEDREDEIVVKLVREPHNQYDPNAVAVVIEAGDRSGQVGYVPAARAVSVSRAMLRSKSVTAVLTDMGCYGKSAKVNAKVEIDIRDKEPDDDPMAAFLMEDEEGDVYEMID